MAEVLVLVEHLDGNVKKVTTELLTKARQLGEPSAVFIGSGFDTAKARLAEFGAAKVYVAADDEYAKYVVAPKVAVLAKLVQEKSPAAVLIASGPEGKEIAGRLAVRTGSGVVTDAVDLKDGFVAEQSVFGGATIVQSSVAKGTPIITMRPNSTAPEAAAGEATEEQISAELSDADKKASVVEKVVEAKSGRPELTEASIVVSGGRGLGGAGTF